METAPRIPQQTDESNVRGWMLEHERHDDDRHEEHTQRFVRLEASVAVLPTMDDIKMLATKEQAEEILKVFNAVSLALKVTSGGGKWFYRAVIFIAALITALATLSHAGRGILLWGVHSFISTKNGL